MCRQRRQISCTLSDRRSVLYSHILLLVVLIIQHIVEKRGDKRPGICRRWRHMVTNLLGRIDFPVLVSHHLCRPGQTSSVVSGCTSRRKQRWFVYFILRVETASRLPVGSSPPGKSACNLVPVCGRASVLTRLTVWSGSSSRPLFSLPSIRFARALRHCQRKFTAVSWLVFRAPPSLRWPAACSFCGCNPVFYSTLFSVTIYYQPLPCTLFNVFS